MPPYDLPRAKRLSPREAQVLGLIARGFRDRETAARTGLKVPTIRVYRSRLEAKLGAKGALACTLVAWRRGDLDLARIADEIEAEFARAKTGAPPGEPPQGASDFSGGSSSGKSRSGKSR